MALRWRRELFYCNAVMHSFLDALIRDIRPEDPLEIVFPRRLRENARRMAGQFPGRMMYAVKCNPAADVLTALWEGGIRHFDAASLDEIALIRGLFPDAGIAFMTPVKTEDAIRRASADFGVTTFAVDSQDELDKVRQLPGADVLVRLALPMGTAGREQSGKFGVAAEEAAKVLRCARSSAGRLGITFHVGSQCLEPADYSRALELAAHVERLSGVRVDMLDAGGGFPAPYADYEPPPFADFVKAISDHADGKDLWCEPGRALAARGEVLVVRVVARKGEALFLNDGIYGGLSPGPVTGFRYNVQAIAADGGMDASTTIPFRLFGPTCDSWDCLPSVYDLPQNIGKGDWIAFDGIGAYAGALRTRFNGLGTAQRLIWKD